MADMPKQIRVCGFVLRPIVATFDNATIIYDIFAGDMKNLRFWMPNGDFKDAGEVFMKLKRREKSTRKYILRARSTIERRIKLNQGHGNVTT